jgi:hypothetical protein
MKLVERTAGFEVGQVEREFRPGKVTHQKELPVQIPVHPDHGGKCSLEHGHSFGGKEVPQVMNGLAIEQRRGDPRDPRRPGLVEDSRGPFVPPNQARCLAPLPNTLTGSHEIIVPKCSGQEHVCIESQEKRRFNPICDGEFDQLLHIPTPQPSTIDQLADRRTYATDLLCAHPKGYQLIISDIIDVKPAGALVADDLEFLFWSSDPQPAQRVAKPLETAEQYPGAIDVLHGQRQNRIYLSDH